MTIPLQPTTGTITPATNPSLQSYAFAGASSQFNYYPTVRIDYNISQKHRLTSTTNYQNYENYPDQTNNQEVRFPLLTHLTLGTPFGDLDLPEIQAGLFTDVGRARFPTSTTRALLGSYGISFRMGLGLLTVLRLDIGRRFSDRDRYCTRTEIFLSPALTQFESAKSMMR